MKNYTEIIVKIILAILLLLCLLKMPFGYYQFIRIGGTIAFLYLLIENRKKPVFLIMWSAFAILFNPIIKIYFSKPIWNIIDAIIAIILILSLINTRTEKK